MNSLNFINKKIKVTQRNYSAFDLDYMLLGRESDKKEAERLLKKLKHLNQIKTELEAWESVKSYLVDLGEVYVLAICNKDKEYITLKKALEVINNE